MKIALSRLWIKGAVALIVGCALAMPVAAKPAYRGFVDLYGGVTLKPKLFEGVTEGRYGWESGFSGALNTTHGVQFNKFLYLGVGTGCQYQANIYLYQWLSYDGHDLWKDFEDCFFVPVYVDLRFDFSLMRKVSPFVDLKCGYKFLVYPGNSDAPYPYFENEPAPKVEYAAELEKHAFYFQPTLGVRLRLGSHTGLNLGMSYLPVFRVKCFGYDGRPLGTLKVNSVCLNVGLDF